MRWQDHISVSPLVITGQPDGTRTVIVSGLDRPTSEVVDWDGTIYVSNRGVYAGTGEVLEITP